MCLPTGQQPSRPGLKEASPPEICGRPEAAFRVNTSGLWYGSHGGKHSRPVCRPLDCQLPVWTERADRLAVSRRMDRELFRPRWPQSLRRTYSPLLSSAVPLPARLGSLRTEFCLSHGEANGGTCPGTAHLLIPEGIKETDNGGSEMERAKGTRWREERLRQGKGEKRRDEEGKEHEEQKKK